MPTPASWIFLVVALVGAWFTFNAYRPHRRNALMVPSFFAGWLTGELSAHHFAWQLVATVFFVWAGALSAWPGWLGLGITAVSWGFLLALVPRAARSAHAVEKGLASDLGVDYRSAIAPELAARTNEPSQRRHLVLPFLLWDSAVHKTKNIRYAEGAGRRHLLDVYAPRAGVRDAPVLLQIHGGAWVIGEKREQALPLMLHLAARGWVCVAINYRLSPKATWPDHIVDVKRAIGWIRENIGAYGGNPDFVVATGGSAGGHLSSLVALTANDPAFQPGFEHVDTSVNACVPFYGVYDFTNEHELQVHGGIDSFLERAVIKQPLAEAREVYRQASPMHRIHAGAPPFFVIHGSHDSLACVEEARHFVALLRETSDSAVVYAEIPGAQHAFEIFHSLRTRHVVRGVDRFLAHVYTRFLEQRRRAA